MSNVCSNGLVGPAAASAVNCSSAVVSVTVEPALSHGVTASLMALVLLAAVRLPIAHVKALILTSRRA